MENRNTPEMFMIPSLFARKFAVGAITVYQKTISPDHGIVKIFYPDGYCKFHPTCSEYTKQAVNKKGVTKGLLMGTGRIFRCNPWTKGGVDEVV